MRVTPLLQALRRQRLALAIAALLSAPLAFAESARLSIVVLDQGRPRGDLTIEVDGQDVGNTDRDGAARVMLQAGARQLVLRDGATVVLELPLQADPDESLQIIVALEPDAEPKVDFESSRPDGGIVQDEVEVVAAAPGVLEGRVVSIDNGQPIAGASVYLSGTPVDVKTDADGRYRIQVSAGEYSLSVIHPGFNAQTLDGVEVVADDVRERAIELTPSGVELPEFVVLEPFVEGSLASFVEERRTSSAVTDILGAEQISRAGDSDAAGALKRVTGLTLVDGKFIYVRGLGERYSSVVLNGASIPSPDQTRRVVPLDLFPTEVLSGIVVQKTYSADMPGEFGGGAIQLRTRGMPEEFTLRVQASAGYGDGTTGKEGLRYNGGSRDWLGRDDGSRAAPPNLIGVPLPGPRTEENAVIGRALASAGYGVDPRDIGPDNGLVMSIGDSFRFGENKDLRVGYVGSLSYSHGWDSREQNRRLLTVLGDGSLDEIGNLDRERTDRSIDSGLFLTVAAELGERHRLSGTVMRLGQTTDQAQVSTGVSTNGNREQRSILEWIENTLTSRQINGEHSLISLGGLVTNWQYTSSRATRDSPNRRDYRFVFEEFPTEGFVFEQIEQRFDDLVDNVDEAQLGFRLPVQLGEDRDLTILAGAGRLQRDRVSNIYRFRFRGVRPIGLLPVDEVFTPGNISPTGLFVQGSGTNTDFYTALQDLDSEYLALDLGWGDWRAYLGARRESNLQQVSTLNPFAPVPTPEVGEIAETDILPAFALTWAYSEHAQLRAGFSETLSRPDFRELSRAPFTDPVLDLAVFGNPNIRQASIKNFDLRWEYYFSPTESLSVALFQKKFTDPIELVRVPGTGELATLENAESASNRGIEIDYYRNLGAIGESRFMPERLRGLPWDEIFLGGNYARIESQINLGEDTNIIQTNRDRALQGQSPYVANLSLAYLPADGSMEATLVYNVFGKRISEVGVLGLPDVIEEPFPQLDFNIRGPLPWEGWRYRFRIRNLLDPTAEFTQGSEVLRSSTRGRDFSLAVEWRW